MYELRYYFNVRNFEIVGYYNNAAIAYGMRKKKSKEPQYHINKLRVVKQKNS